MMQKLTTIGQVYELQRGRTALEALEQKLNVVRGAKLSRLVRALEALAEDEPPTPLETKERVRVPARSDAA